MNCAIHNKPMRQNSRGWYCATKLEDDSWCKYKPNQPVEGQNAPYRSNYRATEPPTGNGQPPRNFDREAYEKCCSIWLAAELHRKNLTVEETEKALKDYWYYFQAIRSDSEKRFATGWNKAVQTFKQVEAPLDPDMPPASSFDNDAEAQAWANEVGM